MEMLMLGWLLSIFMLVSVVYLTVCCLQIAYIILPGLWRVALISVTSRTALLEVEIESIAIFFLRTFH